MKKLILILSLILLVGCKTKKIVVEEKPEEPKIVKLMVSEVDSNQKNKAYDLGKRMLMTCNTSKFKAYDESEATASVINNITLEKLSKICKIYRQRYGTFKDLQLVEVFMNNREKTKVFRYKALYSKKVANKELRVFLNQDNKVSAIKTLDWVDAYDNQ